MGKRKKSTVSNVIMEIDTLHIVFIIPAIQHQSESNVNIHKFRIVNAQATRIKIVDARNRQKLIKTRTLL